MTNAMSPANQSIQHRGDGMSIDTKALKERIYALEADLDTAQHADHEETIRALVVAVDRLAALEAARHAYASEFPLNAEGEPDVDNIHQNIRALKQRLAAGGDQ